MRGFTVTVIYRVYIYLGQIFTSKLYIITLADNDHRHVYKLGSYFSVSN